jgi:hypothetical protein
MSMRMSSRKRQPEPFDVADFLRESDDDLRSALNSLLRNPSAGSETGAAPSSEAGINLSPVLNLAADSSIPDPNLGPDPNKIAGTPLEALAEHPLFAGRPGAGPDLGVDPSLRSDTNLSPGVNLSTDAPSSAPTTYSHTPTNIEPGPNVSAGRPAHEPKKRQFPIREMTLPQDAHTRAEQQVYEYLWENAKPMDPVSRSITIGFGAMARMVRLSESNARINVRSLMAKLAMEELALYDCERSVGRTYRIFDSAEILKRRREAGLRWYMRRTLAVVFVDPGTGQRLDLGIKRPGGIYSGPGPKLGPPYRETSSSPDSLLFETLSQYGAVDDDVLIRLRSAAQGVCPDCTDEEIVHFIQTKGELIRRHSHEISSPVGFLLTAVPKCFAGEAFRLFRKARQEDREREAAERAEQGVELEAWHREQRAILEDPQASDEDKRWARKILYPDSGLKQ